jgi:hypothetical protein
MLGSYGAGQRDHLLRRYKDLLSFNDSSANRGPLAFSALFDFYLALYPATVIWRLHMNLKKKLILSIALGFGVWYVPKWNEYPR